ncbi:MAG: hypothetical protein Tsb0013_21190 [Phycisphaerales bacterium]
MRWIILGIVGVLAVLTVFAYAVILPEERERADLMLAYFDAARAIIEDDADAPRELVALLEGWDAMSLEDMARVATLPPNEREQHLDAFQAYLEQSGTVDLAGVPTLVWSTDDNPARRSQLRLFRAWHLLTYAEPCDILSDPSNRDITKTVVQCVAGAGPDLIEGYGPDQLRPFVQAGVAFDITDEAQRYGFGVDTVFSSAVSSIAFDGRQYAYPCNVGYTVLFYHRDLFEQAGVPEPSGPWTIDEAVVAGRALIEHAQRQSAIRQGLMNLGGWDMALGAGGRFFNDDATACVYDSPETVAGFQALLDITYDPQTKIMPSPEEAASMSTSGGAAMNATQESASASSLFAAKVSAMYVGGRWEYAQLAARNRDRVIEPAVERAMAAMDPDDPRRELLQAALDSLNEDVLIPLSDEEYNAVVSTLTDDDRASMINLGVTHVPTVTGTPRYTVGARFAIANRASPNRDYAVRFLRFLASEAYNETINQTFDSICGMPRYCRDEDGIAGPPRALPGLEEMDSQVFVDAVELYGHPNQLSPYIDRGRLGALAGPIIERLTNGDLTAPEAASEIEKRIDVQMRANIKRDDLLRERWERETGLTFDPDTPLRQQIARVRSAA